MKADALLEFLRCNESEYLYLVGDIFDGWALGKSWYWPQTHNDIVQKVLRKARKGTRVIYIPGNHDEVARQFVDQQFGGITARLNAIHTTEDGRQFLVMHGDEFDGVDSDAVDGAAVTPYKLPRHRVEFVRHETLVPTSWWRGVGGARSAFVVESFVDELARNAKADPLIYRRRLLESDRARAVLDLVAEKARWTQDPGKDRARGVSIIHLWNTFMAQVVEVGRSDDGVRVERVIVAVDCGQPVNPLGIEAQIEGGVIFGLSAALSGEITIADGRVEQSNFHDYTVFRMTDAPRIDIHIVDSTAEVGGLGEPPVAAVMPALANAVCALTGKRIRRLPILKTLAV